MPDCESEVREEPKLLKSFESRWICAVLYLALQAMLFATASQAHNPTEAWHQLRASSKSLKVISAALSYNGRKGGECKAWIQRVVSDATGSHVWLPGNSATVSSTWGADTNSHIAIVGTDIRSAKIGDIVQMVVRYYEKQPDGTKKYTKNVGHTALVGQISNNRIKWIESNYDGKGTVTSSREQSFDEFESSTVSKQYTVYRLK